MRFLRNRAFQVTLVDRPKTDSNSPQTNLDPDQLLLSAQNAVITSAVGIGAVVAGVWVVKTACAITFEVAKKVLN